jgi:ligand-binding sensor domain-containing protein/DNA-binding transcriptional regulator YiaG
MFYGKKSFVTVVLLLLMNIISGQTQPLFFDHLSIKEGLPHNTVYAIAQDQEGFMWFGTHNGLLRYDGYSTKSFHTIKTKNQEEISIKTVHALYLDSKKKLWIGTEDNGLLVYDTKSGIWSKIIDNQQINSAINAIFEDKKGNFWIATMSNGCFLFNAQHQLTQHFDTQNSILQNNSIFSFAEDSNGRIWIAAAGAGLNFYDETQRKIQVIHNQNSPTEDLACFRKCLFWNNDGTLWIGTENDGLYLYHTQNQTFQHYKRNATNVLLPNSISDIKAMPDGKIWLTSDGNGLFVCEPSTMAFRQEKHNNASRNELNTNNLLKIFLDKDENKWLATFNGGINICKKHKTYFPNLTEWTNTTIDFSERSVLGICAAKNGKIWFGTDGNGLNVWDINTKNWQSFKHQTGRNTFPSGSVAKSIFEDSKGNIWVGYFNNGLDCYNPSTGQNQHFLQGENNPNMLSDNNIWSISEDRKGNLWFGTLGGGLNKFDVQTKKITRFFHEPKNENSVSENGIFVVFADENDNIWIGTKNSGLDFYEPSTGKFTHFTNHKNPESISANDIRSIYKDKKGRLWIGTESAGLNLWLGNGKFKKYNTPEGLLNNSVLSISEDEQGILWLSSFQGITRFDAEKETFFNHDFHISDLNNQFNHLAAAKLNDGTLCFGGIYGANFISPNQNNQNTINPQVYLTDFKIFNQSIEPNDGTEILNQAIAQTKEIHLSYTRNLITFNFSALEYTSSYEIRYAFQLVGFDKNCRFTDKKQQSASYNLEPGNYVFKVYSTNSNGVWSDKITEIKVVIHPPFWKTWWFRLMLLVAFAALARWLIQLYNERREEQWKAAIVEQEKEILRLQNEKLASEIEGKTNELMSKALQMGQKNGVMQKLKDGLQDLRQEQTETNLKKLRSLENLVNLEMQDENSWEQFRLYFDQVNHNFTESLLKQYPNLTTNDIRTCILIKLNLSIKEMAALLNISTQGVEKSKYRLKKRLNLNVEDDLTEFLRKF